MADGWTSIEAGDICRKKLTLFSERTLRDMLPVEAKHLSMKREGVYKGNAALLPQIAYKEVLESKPLDDIGPVPPRIQKYTITRTEIRTAIGHMQWNKLTLTCDDNKVIKIEE